MTSQTPEAILQVRDLSVDFEHRKGHFRAIESLGFDLHPGRTTCFVGESGSGKSVTARAVMNIVEPAIISEGSVTLIDQDTKATLDLTALDTDSEQIRAVRGARIAMIFQEPMSSLSPVHTIGQQIIEAIMLHQDVDENEARQRAIEALAAVHIHSPERAVDRYPFEYSGGMRQRAMIAMAIACEPDILIADEPTTALDVTTQAEILLLIRELQRKNGMAVMFITHDMGVVAEIADDVVVMLNGRIVEHGEVDQIFHDPAHAYTRKLIDASLGLEQAEARPLPTRPETPLIEISDLRLQFGGHRGWFSKTVHGAVVALDSVDLTLWPGEILGIVGESGSGKTSLGRILMGRYKPVAGTAMYTDGNGQQRDLTKAASFRDKQVYREIRMIFQDPYSSLNPRMTVEQIIAEPLRINGLTNNDQLREQVARLLDRVGLSAEMMERYPHAFSGGQRQRIGIARAIALNPRVIIADESTSALDGSVRAQILDLLLDLRNELGLSILFIAHDIGVVRYLCDRVAVMHRGRVVETGLAHQVCDSPMDDYTQRLIAAVPKPDPRQRSLMRV